MFDGEHGTALYAMQGNLASSHSEAEVSWLFSSYSGNMGYILELWREWHFKTRVCTAASGLLSSYEGQLRNLHKVCLCNRDTSQGEERDPGSLLSCHRDIGIPINFQEESGIVTFLSIELRVPLELSKGCEASSPDEAGT